MRAARIAVAAAVILPGVAIALGNRNATAETHTREAYAELAQAPEKARRRPNPLENDAEAPLAGRKLYLRHCAECHGENAEGGKKAPSLRAREIQGATPGTLFWVMSNGVVRRGMPVWSKLPEPQRWQIIAFLKSLGDAAPVAARETTGGAEPATTLPQR